MLLKSKILVAALTASACVSVAVADDAYMGVEADYSFKSSTKVKLVHDSDVKFSDAQPGLGLKAGYDFGVWRAYGAYIYDFQASKNGADSTEIWTNKWITHKFIVGTDYTPQVASGFKALVGAYAGLSIMKVDRTWTEFNAAGAVDESGTDKLSFTGYLIGAKVGGIYEINANNEIEFGYKFDRTDYGSSSKHRVSDMKETNHGIYLGYNYKF
ncbi:outer membrane beta-barrel protein [Campylobacter majalis]|uniref:outer membrane beta-barrel protein n=1 Tax=Campylobacter majalis TaxID=2790656 RepID=UPI003D68B01A